MSLGDAEPLVTGDARTRGVAECHINIPEYLAQDPTLSLTDRYIYGVLLKYVMIGERTGQGAFPGLETIARECASSVDSVARSVKRLRERGWVVRKRRGLGLTNRYELYGPSAEDATRGGGMDDALQPQPRDAEFASAPSPDATPTADPEAAVIPVAETAEMPDLESARAPLLDAAGVGHKYDERDDDERQRIPPVVPPKAERGRYFLGSSGSMAERCPKPTAPRRFLAWDAEQRLGPSKPLPGGQFGTNPRHYHYFPPDTSPSQPARRERGWG